MKAATFAEVGAPLEIGLVPDPEPRSGELLIAVGNCGICGTDLHWTENRSTDGGWRNLKPGAVLGHEFAGEVLEVGRDLKARFKPGDSVCALPFIGCGQCEACLTGRIYRCPQADTRATPTLHGAYAELARVGGTEAISLPAGIDHAAGALVEPLAVGLAAVERARLTPSASVLVMGAGPVGLAVALWSRFLGARNVIVSDMVSSRAERAAQFGATDYIDASTEVVKERLQRDLGKAPDVVFECVGVPGTLGQAVDYVANDGVLVVAGLCMGTDTFLPTVALLKAIDIRFTMCYEKRHFEVIVDHLAAGRIDVSKFVTDTVGFDTFADRFESLKSAGSDIKVLLDPRR